MASARQKRAVGIFPDRPTTASALQALQDAGFSMREVSVIARDARNQVAIAGVRVRDRMGHRARQGAIVVALLSGIAGGVAGLLVGLDALVVPGVTPLLNSDARLTGPTKIVLSTAGGAVAGLVAGGALGALFGLGIPYDRAKGFRDRIERGEYVLLLTSSDREFQQARTALLQLSNRDLERSSDASDVPLLPPPAPASFLDEGDANAIASPAMLTAPSFQSATLSQPESLALSPQTDMPALSQPKLSSDSTTQDVAQAASAIPAPPPAHRIPPPRPPAHILSRSSKESQRVAQKSEKRAIAIFPNAQTMERALSALRNANFPMHRLSIMAPDPDHSSIAAADNGATLTSTESSQLASGGTFGSITGLMLGLQSVSVVGSGRFLVAGAEAPALTSALTGKAPTSLAGALMSVGVPEAEARAYSDRLTKAASLVMVRGTAEEALQLASTLTQHGMPDWSIYEIRQAIPSL